MNKIGIFAKTFSGSLEEIYTKAQALGIDTFQFNMVCAGLTPLPLSIPPETVNRITQVSSNFHTSIPAISATFNQISHNSVKKKNGYIAFQNIAHIAADLGANLITLCTGSKHPTDKWAWHPNNATKETWLELLESMEKLILVAEEKNLFLGVEPELANVVQTPLHAIKLIGELQSDRVKIVFDPANLFDKAGKAEIRKIVEDSWELLEDHIALVHAKDRTSDGKFVAVGKGEIDFGHYLGLIRQSSYQGPIIMHGLAEEEVQDSLNHLRNC